MNDFDIVIVGAGPSAIGLIFGILTNPSFVSQRIAVIELGEHAESANSNSNHVKYWFRESHGSQLLPLTSSTLTFGAATTRKRLLYSTTPQTHLNNRILDVPIGMGIGGGTTLNACFCSPPDFNQDFGDWPGVWKNGSLIKRAIEELLLVMRQSGGITSWEVCPRFEKMFRLRSVANQRSGFQQGSQITYFPSYSMATNLNGQRVNYYDAILHPLLQKDKSARERVTFFTGIAVTRIIIKHKIAKGVECIDKKAPNLPPFIINASREVILCAGAILSPVLLILSGVGDKTQLDQAGISECQAHIPAVGMNLRDHVLLPRAFISPNQRYIKESFNSIQAKYKIEIPIEPSILDQEDKQRCCQFEILLADGAITWMIIPHMIASIFRRALPVASIIDCCRGPCSMRDAAALGYKVSFNKVCQIIFNVTRATISLILYFLPVRFLIRRFTTVVNICLLNPHSKGCIEVVRRRNGNRSSSLDDVEVLVNPGYLTNEKDTKALHAGWKASDVLVERHYRSCIEILPGILRRKHDWLSNFAKEFAVPYYHWVGTCAMGEVAGNNDNEFVVNDKLQVMRVQNLRVCDASVFPRCISAPTALTCAGIGLALSSFLSTGGF